MPLLCSNLHVAYEERCRLIGMEEFPSHVKELHYNANRKFEEEYSVLFADVFVKYSGVNSLCNDSTCIL